MTLDSTLGPVKHSSAKGANSTTPGATLGVVTPDDLPTAQAAVLRRCIAEAFPHRGIRAVDDAGQGRGVFAHVLRIHLTPSSGSSVGTGSPVDSVIVKAPRTDANGDAARASGAYDREALAYRSLLGHLDVGAPACRAITDDIDGPWFVLEDLGDLRRVDQAAGLDPTDGLLVATALARLHCSDLPQSTQPGSATTSAIRRNTVGGLDPEGLRRGLDALVGRWADVVPSSTVAAFARVAVRQPELAAMLAEVAPPVLCHGDPRADNLLFDDYAQHHRVVLFDWQQLAIQPGIVDLAWMAATSIEPAVRRELDQTLRLHYSHQAGRTVDDREYRLGFVLPALAVLFLVQRNAEGQAGKALIENSLRRIGAAVLDLDIAGL